MVTIAILIGSLLGALELVILISSRQKLSFWVYLHSFLFWFTCGFMIGVIDSSLSPYMAGALIAVFLNLPWYINISIAPKEYGYLLPLIVASIILGMIGGAVKMFFSPML